VARSHPDLQISLSEGEAVILQTTLGQYTDPIYRAGERLGRAMEAWKRRHWWQNTDKLCYEVDLAYREYQAAFDRLHRFLEEKPIV
jgi:hypothetical protein